MITKECKINKYCCFYVSDFHLELILLPFIKEQLQKNKINIMTQENLQTTIKVLLKKVNLEEDKKNEILNLDWSSSSLNIEAQNLDKNTFIINGSPKYIEESNEQIKKLNLQELNIIDCYNVSKFNIDLSQIKKEYDGVLNTEKL